MRVVAVVMGVHQVRTGRPPAVAEMAASSPRVRASVAQASTAATRLAPTMNPVLLIHQVPSGWM